MNLDLNYNVIGKALNAVEVNKKRKLLVKQDMQIVLQYLQKPSYQKADMIVIADIRLHPQVVGIEASNVIELTNKPTIILGHLDYDDTKTTQYYRGSGRSITQFDLYKAMNLADKGGLMKSFGGHTMACGLTIDKKNIKTLRNRLNKIASKLGKITPTLKPDIEISASDVTWDLVDKLHKLEPFGYGNEAPIIDLRIKHAYNIRFMGNEDEHLSFNVGAGFNAIKVVAFNQGSDYQMVKSNPNNLEVVGKLSMHYFNGNPYLQFVAMYIKHIVLTKKSLGSLFNVVKCLTNGNYQVDVKTLNKLAINHTQAKLGMKVFNELHIVHHAKGNTYLNRDYKVKSLSNSKTFREFD